MMIILVDKNPDLINWWKRMFPFNVPIIQGNILEIRADAIVAPGNSSGAMTGGLDLAIAQKWSYLETKVRDQAPIKVGETVIIPYHPSYGTPRYLIYAPTMIGAMDVSDTNNAYRAMKAILVHIDIGTIVIPGLCAGVGKMPVKQVAAQMVRAYDEIINDRDNIQSDT